MPDKYDPENPTWSIGGKDIPIFNTKHDILKIAQTNPVVHNAMMIHARGDITWDEMLMLCVVALATVNDQITARFQEYLQKNTFKEI